MNVNLLFLLIKWPGVESKFLLQRGKKKNQIQSKRIFQKDKGKKISSGPTLWRWWVHCPPTPAGSVSTGGDKTAVDLADSLRIKRFFCNHDTTSKNKLL